MIAPVGAEARGWGWTYAGRRAPVATGLDLRIEPGERVLLLGASGSGKSTLLHALAGVLGDDEGDQHGALFVGGGPPAAARGSVGLVLQDPDSQIVLSRVGDDVAFGCENLAVPREEIWRRVEQSLRDVGLTVPLDRATSALSGGQKQRLAIAGALAMHAGLLLLDEPTANLDPAGVLEVRDAVARAVGATGATLVVVEHRVAVWRDLVERVVVIDGGAVVADGAPDAVLDREGDRLARLGVWVPGRKPAPPTRARDPRSSGIELLTTEGLVVGRDRMPVASVDVPALRPGRMLGLSGANGSGKSTLALTLGGLLAPVAGEAIAGPLLADGAGPLPHRWRSRQLLTRIGSVFQHPEHQFLTGSVRAELEVGPRALRMQSGEIARRVEPLLERLRLSALAGANPFTLSGGEKRRLSVATALATAPRVLVLDEPTFGQDLRTWTELVALLAELLDEGRAVVSATHDAEFLDALADDRLVLA
ncbi:energy-coupling factor transport system ATP-binding protein [Diaminobutyricimonas aerilata]|uniref:Energy-coupling factor transport system ATP-binding protein n=1 Tax=Diaminobutyricimonas aerilata TaxID=1162967 RepID=A0A2M9CIZ5_9MICO|nr:ATP-binding cassette domain-containing protein [Diaminobutyricimonas aerilata]PJJ71877.1 energy-coupling factor transport system ATP-binding protein [Diaminobutyricimonas aerilata]